MPHQIQDRCSGSENRCMRACPFDSSYSQSRRIIKNTPLLIDGDDCGALLSPARNRRLRLWLPMGHMRGLAPASKGNPHESHIAVVQSESEAERIRCDRERRGCDSDGRPIQ